MHFACKTVKKKYHRYEKRFIKSSPNASKLSPERNVPDKYPSQIQICFFFENRACPPPPLIGVTPLRHNSACFTYWITYAGPDAAQNLRGGQANFLRPICVHFCCIKKFASIYECILFAKQQKSKKKSTFFRARLRQNRVFGRLHA